MTTLTSIPRELRQQILLAAVQGEHLIGGTWPKTVTFLLQTCHLIRDEMAWVLGSWTPLWVLQEPADLKLLHTSFTNGRPTIHHICINVFHRVCVENLVVADWVRGNPRVEFADLLQGWIKAMSQLPKDIGEVILDVTPAPGWLRGQRRVHQLHNLLLDRRTARSFMQAHVQPILNIVQGIHDRFSGRISVKLTGTLSRMSERYVFSVLRQCVLRQLAVEWTGEYISPEQGAAAQLRRIVHSLAPKRRTPDISVEDWQRAIRLASLRRVRWSDVTVKLFARVYSEEKADELWEEIRELAELRVGEPGEVVRKIPLADPREYEIRRGSKNFKGMSYGNLRRALTYGLARDMGFSTLSKGTDESRHVAVMRR